MTTSISTFAKFTISASFAFFTFEFVSDLLSWSSLLCICLFANDSRTQNLRSLYHEHMNSSLIHVSRCSWYQQTKRAQESYHLRKHELEIKHKLKQKAKKLTKQKKKIRIAAKRTEEYTCRRCKNNTKFDSNIKLHEHIRTRHVKKSKSVVSLSTQISKSISSTSSVSSSRSIIFSSLTSSKLLSLSISTSEVVRELSESVSSDFTSIATSRKSISWAEIVSRSIAASKFFRLSIATFKSMCKSLKKSTINCSFVSLISFRTSTSSKSYLTVNDLSRMFVEKSNSFDLQRHQMRFFSSKIFDKCCLKSNCDFIQTRITSYFNATISSASKSIKFEAFESTHVRENVSRQFSISSSISSIFFFFDSQRSFAQLLIADTVNDVSSSIDLSVESCRMSQELKSMKYRWKYIRWRSNVSLAFALLWESIDLFSKKSLLWES